MSAPGPSTVTSCRVVLCTAPADRAGELADRLLDARLAACVNLIAGVESRYVWDGAPQVDRETLLVIKADAAVEAELIERLAEWHPYAVPEVLVLPVVAGLGAYLAWVGERCGVGRDA